ncbi:MFS general substrate transporter [Artomyces pyxidatus]|uniref:MFS general substrate transporter n=1 Tax=Artomyces pyxidatus TaxID=48021 RepID=A0ACB8TCC4_9AGAM|nr:MFS general substrate transporter [Artomyces pyxidatus]
MSGLDDTISDQEQSIRLTFDAKEVDTGAALVNGESVVLDAAEGLRLRKKIDRHILPLMCILYLIQAMDKSTLSYSAILGIRTATHLTTNQYNWLGTIYSLSYLFFEYPQNLALQRFPAAKWMSLNIFIWSIYVMCHAACTNFAGLFVLRLIVGMCEGAITAGFMISSSMFWTRNEQFVRIGLWYSMTGAASIVGGFVSFGSLHIHTKSFEPWQWLMVITGAMTFLIGVVFYLYFPDAPTNAWFLTEDEKIKAIQRANQTGIENKFFKKTQLSDAMTDAKTWLFGFYGVLCGVAAGGLIFQRQIIVSSFGFSNLQTTLLGCVDGVIVIVSIYIGVRLASRIPDSRAWLSMAFYIPNILGLLLVNLLPWSNQIGLLFSMWLTNINTASFVLVLVWVGQTTAGHTKKVTTNAIMLSGNCLGAAVAQFLWQARFRPRNHIPWIGTGIAYVLSLATLFSIRVILDLRNKRRATDTHDDSEEDIYVLTFDGDGKEVEVKVDKEFLDLTDMQNKDFRYVL